MINLAKLFVRVIEVLSFSSFVCCLEGVYLLEFNLNFWKLKKMDFHFVERGQQTFIIKFNAIVPLMSYWPHCLVASL